MVKIITKSGKEEKFDSHDVKKDLESAGFPERVAEEVAERVKNRVEDRWTSEKVHDEIDLQMNRLEEDIGKAHNTYKSESVESRKRMPEEEKKTATESERESHYKY